MSCGRRGVLATDRWQRVESLCHAALARPLGERARFLAQACGSDDALRVEVSSLVARAESAASFLETPAVSESSAALVGRQLGAYRLEARIGAGGMGEVYRARDTRLGREVAVKVLSALELDARRRARFEREARAVAALNHPNICTLYDVGCDQGIDFLVMELVDGESLARRLANGPLPIDQALACATDIADALDHAHRLGIIHRDLTPGNVMLTKPGSGAAHVSKAKLLDFGLARILDLAIEGGSSTPQSHETLTAAGAMLGTLPYMAPEQIEGRPTDARTDVFAFGAVLYEMLTGRRAFAGSSPAALMAAILRDDAPSLTVDSPLHRAIDRVIQACLAKDPADRFSTMHDVLLALRGVAADAQSAVPARADAAARRRIRLSGLGWAIRGAGVLAAVLAIGWLGAIGVDRLRRPAASRAPSVSFSIYPPEGTRFPRGTADMAVSPDGSRLVFSALSPDGTSRLWLRRFDSVVARLLDGTDGARRPFWSPDGQAIGFFTRGKVKRISEAGGLPQILCEAGEWAGGGTWSRQGIILFSTHDGPIRLVADSGGTATPVTALTAARNEFSHEWPVFLPDGRHFLYRARSGAREHNAIYRGSLDSPEVHRVATSESSFGLIGRHLLSVSNHALIAQVYDPDQGRLVGKPITVVSQIELDSPLRSGGAFSVGTSGALAYRSASPDSHLVWFDRTGREVGAVRAPADYHHPWLSPDQKRVVVEKTDPATGRHTLWILELSRGTSFRLLYDGTGAHLPVWSPDGRRVVFSSDRLGGLDLYSISADGSGSDALMLSSREKAPLRFTDWSLDGRLLLYQVRHRGQEELWVAPASDLQKGRPFFETPANEQQGQFSPDTRWIAYTSNESSMPEVYVRRFPEADGKWQVSTQGGTQPRWRRDGKELFYLALDGKLMAADVKAGAATIQTGTPSVLFKTGITASFIERRNQYLVTRDGQRFLVNISAEDENSAPITVVLNWEAALAK